MGSLREARRRGSLRRAALFTWSGRALAVAAVAVIAGWIVHVEQGGHRHGFAGGSVRFTPCLIRLVAAQCGQLAVPEDPEHPDRRTITLLISVLPAARQPAQGALFYLEGGPGGAASAAVPEVDQLFGRVAGDRDIVLVDQRGTGGSNPLSCPPSKTPVSDAAAIAGYVRRCFAQVGAKGRFYTTAAAAEDIERVRRALGFGRIDLFGGSYGATAAQVYLQLHPSSVRTVILDGGSLLNVHLYELAARNAEHALDEQLARCTSEPACRRAFPNTRAELTTLLSRGPRQARAYGLPVTLDSDAVAGAVRALSLTETGVPLLPAAIHSAVNGDYTPLADAFADNVGSYLDARARLVTSFEILCSEPWARFDPTVVQRLRGDSYFGDVSAARANLFAKACPSVPRGLVPAGSELQTPTNVPVLLLAGSADPLDPPTSLTGWQTLFPNGRLVVVPGGTHGVIADGCLQRIAADFVARGNADRLDTRCAAGYRPPPFTF